MPCASAFNSGEEEVVWLMSDADDERSEENKEGEQEAADDEEMMALIEKKQRRLGANCSRLRHFKSSHETSHMHVYYIQYIYIYADQWLSNHATMQPSMPGCPVGGFSTHCSHAFQPCNQA